MEVSLMFYLHQNIIHSRIDEEFSRLLATGSNHRDVLIEYYSDTTLKHIILMEKGGDRGVIITDHTGEIILSSEEELEKYLPSFDISNLNEDKIVLSDWKISPYIISKHPFQINSQNAGFVVMFQSTQSIEQLVRKLNTHFWLAGVISVVALFIIYAVLSKFLTRPLIRMKVATEKLSTGDFNVSLPFIGKDELGELSVSIQKLANDLERLKKERNEFFASIAHELSTPLTYLIGYSKVAIRQDINNKDRTHYLKIIEEESGRMKELVDNLLDLAKLDENTFTVFKKKFWAHAFFKDILKLVTPSFDLKNIQIKLILERDFLIEADSLRLEQIVLNLLDNALKYSNRHSIVTIEAYKKREKTIISITDTGIGIPQEELEFIFEKLYRVEKSRSRSFGGSGIGLAIVKELIDAHDGKIEVKSRLGEGSSFTVEI